MQGARAVNNPRDVAYLNGKLYVDDTGWNRVQVLNASNGAAHLAVAGATRARRLGPQAIHRAITSSSSARTSQNRVQEFTPQATECATFGTAWGRDWVS